MNAHSGPPRPSPALDRTAAGPPGEIGLAATPASHWDRGIATALLLVSLVVAAAVVPIANEPWLAIPAFIPAHQSAVAVCDLVTAALVLAQFREARRPSLLPLGAAYLYTAIIVVAHAVSFPNLFGPGSLIGGPQTTVWLWLAWHVPLPLAIIAYAWRGLDPAPRARPFSLTVAVLLALALAATAILLTTVGHDWLPPLLDGNRYIDGVTRPLLAVPLALSLLGVLALVVRTRLRRALDIWLAVTMGAWAIEILLSAVVNSAGSRPASMSAGSTACSPPARCWSRCFSRRRPCMAAWPACWPVSATRPARPSAPAKRATGCSSKARMASRSSRSPPTAPSPGGTRAPRR